MPADALEETWRSGRGLLGRDHPGDVTGSMSPDALVLKHERAGAPEWVYGDWVGRFILPAQVASMELAEVEEGELREPAFG